MTFMASSYTRVSEGVYERHGRFYAPKTRNGKKDWGMAYTSAEAAQEAREKRLRQRDAAKSGDETVDSFLDRWVHDYGHSRSEATNTHNMERARRFAQDFEGRTLRSITRVEARQWVLGSKGTPWEGKNNRRRLAAVRAMFSDALRDGLCDENPFVKMGLKTQRGRKDIVVLTDRELGLLVHTAGEKWGDFGRGVVGPMIAVAAWTGLRPGELYALREVDIDYEADRIHVRRQWSSRLNKYTQTKTRAAKRKVPLVPPAAAALKSVTPRPINREAPLFQTPRDKGGSSKPAPGFTQRTQNYYWTPVRSMFWAKLDPHRREQIPVDFDFYELRHFFGSKLASMGFSPFDIAKAMGHEDGGQTAMEFYIHTDEDEAADRIVRGFREEQMRGGEDREAM